MESTAAISSRWRRFRRARRIITALVSVGADHGHSFEIKGMVEKPPQSTFRAIGRFGCDIWQPQTSELLEKSENAAGGEIQLTDAMIKLAATQPFHGVCFDGKTYDTGS